MKINGYPSREKLKKKSEIDLLFKKGKWLSVDNLRIIYFSSSEKHPIESCKIGVSVSKKFFKKAVDRNRIKRLLRESYRLNKATYFDAFGEQTLAMLFWVSKDLPEHFSDVEKQFINLCKKKKG
ncbi:ribonuclease P protein component [Epilithonimonas arachidiradicis]|uniref:Ribonuclease P protein component n=1 Tax=Epilithonimonas arachidiradicis TaxID=1617282 RepID=A0A420DCN8_9FLAO|nr:ribonuclease P protein component [Epilithonimonas arachidiradicis]RKE89655.1 ribonuclease P protein component [Epilithonimonas arachidiradicis]GGG44244.1 ribonuclease P protein component [Epilithonimonas arachidiradicis]